MAIGNIDILSNEEQKPSEDQPRHYRLGPGPWDSMCKNKDAVFMTSIWRDVTCEECKEARPK